MAAALRSTVALLALLLAASLVDARVGGAAAKQGAMEPEEGAEKAPEDVVTDFFGVMTDGEFPDRLPANGEAGASACGIGDVDGDGVADVAFGAPRASEGSLKLVGRVMVGFVNGEYEVQRATIVHATDGRSSRPAAQSRFGHSCAGLGDVDQDGVPDMAVGMPNKPGSTTRGAVVLDMLKRDGSVHKSVRIAPGAAGSEKLREDEVPAGASFGSAMTGLGRFFEGAAADGVSDLAVGAPGTDQGRGAVHLLDIGVDGEVLAHKVIKSGSTNFVTLPAASRFGAAVTLLGDVDGDGVGDIAVGAPGEDNAGAVYVVLLTAGGAVKSYAKIMKGAENFDFQPGMQFGSSVAAVGDVNGDGVPDLLIGGPYDPGEGDAMLMGSGYLVLLQPTGKPAPGGKRVTFPKTRGNMVRGFSSVATVARLPSAREDVVVVGAVGMKSHYEGSRSVTGGVELMRLKFPEEAVESMGRNTSASTGAVFPYLRPSGASRDCKVGEWSAWSTCSAVCGLGYEVRQRHILAEPQGEGKRCPSSLEEHRSCDMGPCEPATVMPFGVIGRDQGGFKAGPDDMQPEDEFGAAVCSIGDIDGDEHFDLAAGAPGHHEGRGQLFVMELTADKVVRSAATIGSGAGGFEHELKPGDRFGAACAGLGDMNQDGVPDVAVAAPGANSAFVLRMTKEGTVSGHARFGPDSDAFPEGLADRAPAAGLAFGASVSTLGFLLGDDDVPDLAVGAPNYDGFRGALVLAQLRGDGTVAKAHAVVGGQSPGFDAEIGKRERFGSAVSYLGDVNGDGAGDIAVGSPYYGGRRGRVFVLLLTAEGGVLRYAEMHSNSPGFDLPLTSGTFFGAALAPAGDVDGDGIVDVAVGAPKSNAKDMSAGALYVVLLRRSGDAKEARRSLPGAGHRQQEVYSSIAPIDFAPDNRTLTLAYGAPRAAKSAGEVLLGNMAVEQVSDTVGDLVPFPTLHIPRDCVLTNWTTWSNCSEACGSGIQFRTRAVLMQAEAGGRNCSQFEMEQERACNTQHCPIDCETGEWNPWSQCTAECGGGRQRRNRTVQVYPDFGGAECGNLTEARECNTGECPVACELSAWGPWNQCSQECGGGEQSRNRSVLVQPQFGADACGNLSETRDCNTQRCPIACEVGEWGEWAMCNTTCGGGVQTRSREIVQRPMFGAEPCPELEEGRACNTHDCPFDCKLSEWSAWSNCSEWCGPGMQERHRDVERYPSPDGAPCGNVSEVRKCEARPCPVDCRVGNWTEWGECSAECGPGGRRNRTRKVRVHPKHGGERCPALVEEEDCFVKSCPVDCEVGAWGNWSACDPWCGQGKQHRARKVVVDSDFGGAECPELREERACNARPCPVDCEVTEWEDAAGCSARCGGGKQPQTRKVRVPPKHGGEACPALARKVACNEYPCAEPVLDTEPCASYGSCAACVADDRCGWTASLGKCLRGVVRGPLPLWSSSPKYMKNPYREFLVRANVTAWAFAYCPGEQCGQYKGCAACIADPQCGHCGTSGECLFGAGSGPTRGAFCPRGWVYAPELSANRSELLPAKGEIRVTEPRPAKPSLENYCSAEPYLRTRLWKRLVKEGPHVRPHDTCRPCDGAYPNCDCARLLESGNGDAAAADAAAQQAAELAAENASEEERKLAEQAAQALRDQTQVAMESADASDVTGQDDAFEKAEQVLRPEMAERADSAEDSAQQRRPVPHATADLEDGVPVVTF